MTRPVRILLVANDGFSAGHVSRALAIAGALRGLEASLVLATTSEADALLRASPAAVVRLPSISAARGAGFSDAERRALSAATLRGVVDGFAPDAVVSDTFPNGPHGELAWLGTRVKRAVVRRAVPDESADVLTSGLGDVAAVIVASDAGLPGDVPPIVLAPPRLSRDEARARLGIQGGARAVLVTCGGGGDAEAVARARDLAAEVRRCGATAIEALGPLAGSHLAPLGAYLAAFDGAFSPAGYNTAHELASAGVPAALWACARPYDDQAARARRLAASGHAIELAEVAEALAWMARARIEPLAANGAELAAARIVALVTGGAR